MLKTKGRHDAFSYPMSVAALLFNHEVLYVLAWFDWFLVFDLLRKNTIRQEYRHNIANFSSR